MRQLAKPRANRDPKGRMPQKHSGRTGRPIDPANFIGLDDNGEVSAEFVDAQKIERRMFARNERGRRGK